MTSTPLVQHIRVVVHEATRSGAVRSAMRMVEHLRSSGRRVSVEILGPGPLETELMALDDARDAAIDAVVLNSALSLQALAGLPREVPVALYLHEDEETLDRLVGAAMADIVDRCRSIWCVSDTARDQLVDLGVPAPRLAVLPPEVTPPTPDPERAEALRTELADGYAALVLGCGETSWHKGPDLFLDMARRVRDQLDATFVWVGRQHRDEMRRLIHDTALVDMSDHLRWLPAVDDVGPLVDAADLLVMPSRRDAQPITPFEAAVAGTPTLGFSVGGLAEYGERGLIVTVEYPDTVALAGRALELLADAPRREGLAGRSRSVAESERGGAALGPRLCQLIDDLVGGSS